MKCTYDKKSNSAYISLKGSSEKVSDTESVIIEGLISFPQMNFDIDENKKIIGIEILDANTLLSEEFLKRCL